MPFRVLILFHRPGVWLLSSLLKTWEDGCQEIFVRLLHPPQAVRLQMQRMAVKLWNEVAVILVDALYLVSSTCHYEWNTLAAKATDGSVPQHRIVSKPRVEGHGNVSRLSHSLMVEAVAELLMVAVQYRTSDAPKICQYGVVFRLVSHATENNLDFHAGERCHWQVESLHQMPLLRCQWSYQKVLPCHLWFKVKVHPKKVKAEFTSCANDCQRRRQCTFVVLASMR
mmetsp:Transcript_127133/g.220371  ORF Transcript_127133/g.220371 Transcript_127133/m.220371 type:complete len:226 (+) Transcript_127133:451-1128(+)